MKFRYLLLFLLVFIESSTWAQPKVAELDKYIAKARKDWNVPGIAVAIVKDGKVILSKGYGVREMGGNNPVDSETLFAIASNTKAFVATSLGQLAATGKLDWNDMVVNHLPYFELYDDYATRHATIEDLLCHRLGLGTFSGDLMWYKSRLSAEDVVKKIKYVPQAYEFRNGYGYSNLMFITAGEVIKSVTGLNWDVYVKQNITVPLDMARTVMSTEDLEVKGNYATPHKPDKNGTNAPIPWVNWDNMGAAGGIISSSDDMAKWLMMNLNGGKTDKALIITSEEQNRLWTPHNNHLLSDAAKEAVPGRHFSGYGLGYGISDYHGRMLVSHGGGYDGMYSQVMMVPDENLGVVVLTNSMKGISTPLCYYIINQFIKEDMRDWSAEALAKSNSNKAHFDDIAERTNARVADTNPRLPLDKYAGTYWAGMHGNVVVTKTGDKLSFYLEDNPALAGDLVHWHYDTWEIQWKEPQAWFDFGTLQFKLDNNMKVIGLHFDVPNGDIFFDEVDLVKKR